MNREKKLIKNTIIYAIGNFGSKFLSFLLLPLYTYYLTTGDYGYFDLITTTISLLIPLITFQINDGLYRYLLEANNIEDKSNQISNSFFITMRNLLVFNLVYIILIQFKSFRYDYIILLQIDFNIVLGLWAQISRGLKRNLEYAVSGMITTVILLISNIVFITILKYGVGSLIISNVLASIGSIIYLDYKLKIHNYINYKLKNKSIKKNLILYSIPLIPNVISWWFMNVSDRYFLDFYKGLDANGIYAVSNKFPSILIMINSIFYLAWQESAISEYNSKDKNKFYSKMFNILADLEFTAILILLAFTKFIMKYMVDSKFYFSWEFIPFLYFGTIFNAFSSFYGTGYQSSKETIGAFYTSIFGAVTNILLNIILIPVVGIQGASLSTMVSFLIMWLARVWQTKKYFKIDINKNRLISLMVISIFYTIFYYLNISFMNYFLMVLSLILFIIYNKSLINGGIRAIKKLVSSRNPIIKE
jgi:O-antigen/teichoic acid export membrane protein